MAEIKETSQIEFVQLPRGIIAQINQIEDKKGKNAKHIVFQRNGFLCVKF